MLVVELRSVNELIYNMVSSDINHSGFMLISYHLPYTPSYINVSIYTRLWDTALDYSVFLQGPNPYLLQVKCQRTVHIIIYSRIKSNYFFILFLFHDQICRNRCQSYLVFLFLLLRQNHFVLNLLIAVHKSPGY